MTDDEGTIVTNKQIILFLFYFFNLQTLPQSITKKNILLAVEGGKFARSSCPNLRFPYSKFHFSWGHRYRLEVYEARNSLYVRRIKRVSVRPPVRDTSNRSSSNRRRCRVHRRGCVALPTLISHRFLSRLFLGLRNKFHSPHPLNL